VRAYVGEGGRALTRRDTAKRHAVDEWVIATGLPEPETECDKVAAIDVGEWDPDDERNCAKCAAIVAGLQVRA
jgi:hypothetical protein